LGGGKAVRRADPTPPCPPGTPPAMRGPARHGTPSPPPHGHAPPLGAALTAGTCHAASVAPSAVRSSASTRTSLNLRRFEVTFGFVVVTAKRRESGLLCACACACVPPNQGYYSIQALVGHPLFERHPSARAVHGSDLVTIAGVYYCYSYRQLPVHAAPAHVTLECMNVCARVHARPTTRQSTPPTTTTLGCYL
jgi:hypothetical protein